MYFYVLHTANAGLYARDLSRRRLSQNDMVFRPAKCAWVSIEHVRDWPSL